MLLMESSKVSEVERGESSMPTLGERTGAILVENIAEAKKFYKETFGLTDVSYHGMDMLELNGKLFFYMWEVPAKQAEEYRNFMHSQSDKLIIYATIELETAEDVRRVYDIISKEGKAKRPISVQPWSPGSADVIDKYGVNWYISAPMVAPPEGCIMCHPPDQPPETPCEPCVRWEQVDYKCPRVVN